MALAVTIASNGTTWHLNNSSGAPTVGGAATAAATSPFMLIDDSWTVQSAPPDVLWSGGPPFHDGSIPVVRTTPNVTESFTLICAGSSHDNSASLVRTLSQLLNTALFTAPCVLGYQPSGATSMMYTEIYSAVVQPTTNYLVNPVRGSSTITLQVTITCAPLFGASSLATLINAATFNNTGTGGSNNTQSLGALTGDLIYEGQPLNIKLAPSAANGSYVLATVLSRTYAASVAGGGTTSSTTFVAYTSGVNLAIPTVRDNRGVRVRIHARVKTLTNPTKAKMRCTLTGGGYILATMPFTPTLGSDTTGQFVDFGGVSLEAIRNTVVSGGSAIQATFEIASTDGTSVTVQLDYSEMLLYYDYMAVEAPATSLAFWLAGAQNINGGVWLPMAQGVAVTVDSSNVQQVACVARGTYPRAFSGASLYMAMYATTTKAHVVAHTATITVNHAPLYRVMRGAG